VAALWMVRKEVPDSPPLCMHLCVSKWSTKFTTTDRIIQLKEVIAAQKHTLYVALGVRLQCMDHVWERDAISNKEYWHIVTLHHSQQ
jgi:hypothetical protein